MTRADADELVSRLEAFVRAVVGDIHGDEASDYLALVDERSRLADWLTTTPPAASEMCEFCVARPAPEGQFHPDYHDEGRPMAACDECMPPAASEGDR